MIYDDLVHVYKSSKYIYYKLERFGQTDPFCVVTLACHWHVLVFNGFDTFILLQSLTKFLVAAALMHRIWMWAIRISESSPSSSEGSKVVREKAELATLEAWMTSLRSIMQPNRHGSVRHLGFYHRVVSSILQSHLTQFSITRFREFSNVFWTLGWQVESKYNDILVALEEPCALHFEDFSGSRNSASHWTTPSSTLGLRWSLGVEQGSNIVFRHIQAIVDLLHSEHFRPFGFLVSKTSSMCLQNFWVLKLNPWKKWIKKFPTEKVDLKK